jgi:WD40 repeat protein
MGNKSINANKINKGRCLSENMIKKCLSDLDRKDIRKCIGFKNSLIIKHLMMISINAFKSNFILTGSDDNDIIVWDSDGNYVDILSGHCKAVTCILVYKKDEQILSGSLDKEIRIWDGKYRKLCGILGQGCPVICMIKLKAHKRLIMSGGENKILKWDIDLRQCLSKYNTDALIGIFLKNINIESKFIVIAVNEGMKLLNWETGEWKGGLKLAHDKKITAILNLRNCIIASASHDTQIKIWDTNDWKFIKAHKHHSNYVHCMIHVRESYANLIASGSWDNTIVIFNWLTGEIKQTINDSFCCLKALRVRGNGLGSYIIRGGLYDKKLKLWDWKLKKCELEISGHISAITVIATY